MKIPVSIAPWKNLQARGGKNHNSPKSILSTKMSGELQQHHSLELHSYQCVEART